MLLNRIGEEFEILEKIVCLNNSYYDNSDYDYKIINDIVFAKEKITIDILLSWNSDLRKFSKVEGLLENRKFSSNLVQNYAQDYIYYVKHIFENYDNLARIFLGNANGEYDILIGNNSIEFCRIVEYLYKLLTEIHTAKELIPLLSKETWESLPDDKKNDNVNNIIISSETKSISLNDVASDVGNLDSFFNNICLVINQDVQEKNNVYLRKVETGSLAVIVSCLMETAPIIAFIFWCVKLYQKSEKRYLDNADKKLKLINDSMNMAKEILMIDPNNKEADEIIQKCGVHILNFLENNPKGTINGESYDIGRDKLKIEEKD